LIQHIPLLLLLELHPSQSSCYTSRCGSLSCPRACSLIPRHPSHHRRPAYQPLNLFIIIQHVHQVRYPSRWQGRPDYRCWPWSRCWSR
jgi:hypothetical protein